MYRKSKYRKVRKFGVNAAVALFAMGSGIAVSTAVMNQSQSTLASPATAVVAPTSTTSAPPTTTAVPPAAVTSPPATVVTTPPATAISNTVPVPGRVLALSGSSITLRTTAGATVSYRVSSATIVMSGRTRTSLASVKVGAQVYLVPSSSNPPTAVAIGIVASHGGEPSDNGSGSSIDN